MKLFVTLCAFVADWLLFVFPLLQGKIELMESNSVFKKYQETSSKAKKKFSFKNLFNDILWLVPPLRLYYFKKTSGKELFKLSLNKEDFSNFYTFTNKAKAWYYVSYAGFLNAIYTTYELVEIGEFTEFISITIFLIIIIIMTIMGIRYDNYVVGSKRKINLSKKLIKKYKNKKG